jgi:hypothetical protein
MENNENQENMEQKQQYLRDEILNKNYDIEEFSEFMSQYKENGLDLMNWTFDELKDAVKKFKSNNIVQTKEDEEKIIEKGIENIRKSYIINEMENQKINSQNKIGNNENNNIMNNNNKKMDFDIDDDDDDFDNNIIYNNKLKNSSVLFGEMDLTREKANNNINIQNMASIPNQYIQNINFQNNNINKNGNVNANKNNYIINQINQNDVQLSNERKNAFGEFEILDNPYINNNNNFINHQLVQCIKQPENSLTNINDLFVNLEV